MSEYPDTLRIGRDSFHGGRLYFCRRPEEGVEYIRADLAAQREAELVAEVERLSLLLAGIVCNGYQQHHRAAIMEAFGHPSSEQLIAYVQTRDKSALRCEVEG